MPAEPRRRAGRALGAVLAVLAVAGCTPVVDPAPPSVTPTAPTPTPSPTPAPRDFTMVTSGPLHTADPAVALEDTDTLVATSVYQRLMQVLPTGELKPDLATDCIFTSATVYECTLPPGLTFHNGDALTSSDVRFSIQRALRLNAAGTAVQMLDSLVRISAPDPLTIRFHLGYTDNRFGFGLAALAASIVDEQHYDPDAALPLDSTPVGSGPYEVSVIGASGVTFTRFDDYTGPLAGALERIRLELVEDSVAAEAAITLGTADLVWRSLDPAAVQRVEDEIAASAEHATAEGFTRVPLAGTRITRLQWSVDSPSRMDATLRAGVALALQGDRTLASLVPVGMEGYLDSFAIGGRPTLPSVAGGRVNLTLGYDPSSPGHADLANLIRGRIEELDKVSVRLTTEPGADLVLTDRPAWVATPSGWLQSYTDEPLPGSLDKIAELDLRARTTSGDPRIVALGELQKQAAVDLTVLPVSQDDGILFVGRGVTLSPQPFGSGGQLGLWGIQRG